MPSWIRSSSGHLLAPVVLGDRHHQAQVRVDHALLGLEVAALDPLGELDLLVGGEQAVPADLVQEQLQGVAVRARGFGPSQIRYCPCSPSETARLRSVYYDAARDRALAARAAAARAISRGQLPEGDEWSYEPKWDGFRAIAFVDGDETFLQSRNGRPLSRYFPELAFPRGRLRARRRAGDPRRGRAAGLRRAPAADPPGRVAHSRSWRRRCRSRFVAFDLLAPNGEPLLDEPFAKRRKRLEKLVAQAARR